jgi:integrase/recombinase XerC
MISYREGVCKYLNYLRVVKNVSEHTVRNYGLDLKGFKDFFKAEASTSFSVLDVDRKAIRAYLSSMAAKKAAKKTIVRHLSSLRSFFKYLVKEKLIEHNPLDEIESPKLEKKIPPSLSYDQIERLFSQPDISTYLGFRDRCIMELFYSSGLRISELVDLDRGDVDEKNFCLRVMGKGKKERITPMTQTAAHWLKN